MFSRIRALDPNCLQDFVVVTSKNDLPKPVGNVITLNPAENPSVTYIFRTSLDLGPCVLEILPGFVSMLGFGPQASKLNVDSTSPIITCTGTLRMDNISPINVSGPGLDFNAPGNLLEITSSRFISAAPDLIRDGLVLNINFSQWANGKGIVISGSGWDFINFSRMAFDDLIGAVSYLTFDSTVGAEIICLDNLRFKVSSASQVGLDIDSAVIPTTAGELLHSQFIVDPGATALAAGGIDQKVVGWHFKDNAGIQNSAAVGAIQFDDNATATTISVSDTYVPITTSVAWALSPLAERFSIKVDGAETSIEYLGTNPIKVLILSSVFLNSSNNNEYKIGIFVNDAASPTDEFSVDIQSNPLDVSHGTILEMVQGDFVEIRVKGVGTTIDPTIKNAQIAASRVG